MSIGKQVWSATNLEVLTFRNGDTIPHARSAEEWQKAGREGTPGEFTYMTSATEADLKDSRNDQMAIWGRGVHVDNKTVMRCALDKHFGLYVRCVRDAGVISRN